MQNERDGQVVLTCDAESVLLPLDSVTALGMVVAELVTNSYGHAFPDQTGTIAVILKRAGIGRATLIIQDDGTGFVAKGVSTRRGLGLVQRPMKQVNGTIEVDSGNGTCCTLAFATPISPSGLKTAA